MIYFYVTFLFLYTFSCSCKTGKVWRTAVQWSTLSISVYQFFILCFSPAFSPFQHWELPEAPLSLCFDVLLVVYGEELLPQMLHIESWRFLSHAAQTLKHTYTHNEISIRLLKISSPFYNFHTSKLPPEVLQYYLRISNICSVVFPSSLKDRSSCSCCCCCAWRFLEAISSICWCRRAFCFSTSPHRWVILDISSWKRVRVLGMTRNMTD